MHYRDYRKYCNHSFRQELLSTLVMENINLSNDLQKIIDMETLDKFAPRKKKYSRRNNRSSLENYTSNITTPRDTTQGNTSKTRTTRDNTSTIRDNTSTTRHNTSATRDNKVQHETTRVQNNINCFLFIYIIAVYSETDILSSKTLFIL